MMHETDETEHHYKTVCFTPTNPFAKHKASKRVVPVKLKIKRVEASRWTFSEDYYRQPKQLALLQQYRQDWVEGPRDDPREDRSKDLSGTRDGQTDGPRDDPREDPREDRSKDLSGPRDEDRSKDLSGPRDDPREDRSKDLSGTRDGQTDGPREDSRDGQTDGPRDDPRDGTREDLSEDPVVLAILLSQLRRKIAGYKHQDKRKGKFDPDRFIRLDPMIQQMLDCQLHCHYCQAEMNVLYDLSREGKQWTVDRIDNHLGHNSDNVTLACLDCNLRRRRRSDTSFLFSQQLKHIKKEEVEVPVHIFW